MSLQFNDTVAYKGLVQIYEKELGLNRGDISGDNDKLKDFTADCNLALDDLFYMGVQSSGTWQLDDSNFSDYPIIKANIISGQRDYQFLKDQDGNFILDIYKVVVSDSLGNFQEILPVNQQSLDTPQLNVDSFINGQNASGVPSRYDKTANAIFLDVIPNYNYTQGLFVYINREPSYFVYTDTTKFPGIAGTLHRYLALKPALDYARRNSLACHDRLAAEVQMYEQIKIPGVFGNRQKDVRRGMQPNVEYTR